ncbi:MAG: hypothetical protein WC100_17050 [Sterolibacterium sp.]
MKTFDLIMQAKKNGATFSLTPSGRLRLTGDQLAIDRYLPIVRQYQVELIAELSRECPSGSICASPASDQGEGDTSMAVQS